MRNLHSLSNFIPTLTTKSWTKSNVNFRASRLDLVDMYEDKDSYDILEREPTIAKFQRKEKQKGKQKEFTFIPIHIKPKDAVKEMNGLVWVSDEAERRYGPDIIIAGDLNADCSYVCKSCWRRCQLKMQTKFRWLIGDKADTTTKKTDCAYDRIILRGKSMINNSCCAHVYRFDLDLGIDQELVEDVSDHYPVEFTVL